MLVLESRRTREMAAIVTSYGGAAVTAPSMREVPLASNTEAVAFVDRLERGGFDLVILLTGVGTRALVSIVDEVKGDRQPFVAALGRVKVAARGPKPVAALRELGVPVWVTAPEPNTWRELLATLDERREELSLAGARVAVQEYGASNPELLEGLATRGAIVTPVPVYQWALPDDLEPLRSAIQELAAGKIDVALFTTATQAVHLWKVADTMGLAAAVSSGLNRGVVGSIGPTTSEELRRRGIEPDFEPTHPKMGFLVREAAERAADILSAKRGKGRSSE